MLSLVAVALLAQAEAAPGRPLPTAPSSPNGCAVALVRAEGMTAEEGAATAGQVAAALNEQGIPVPLAPSELLERLGGELKGCAGKGACHAALARSVGAGAIVTVDAAKLFGELSVELALLDAAGGRLLADKVFAGAPDSPAVAAQLADFARTARYALMTLPAFQAPAVDAPVLESPRVTDLTPSEEGAATPPLAAVEAARRPAPVLAYAATGAAAAAGVTAAIFGGLAVNHWVQAAPQNGISPRPRSEAEAMTRNSWIAGGAGAACAALTGAAVYLWLNPPAAK